ncbi:MAG: hypothetical protein IT355_08175 [Gemmatimonadaceae bacterium]|nr:hypothetical protein [Gemmatimonadaceae bacterium]
MAARSFLTAAAAPLVTTARTLDWPRRQAFLDDLRADAPALIAEVERLLHTGNALPAASDAEFPLSHTVRAGLAYLRRLAPRLPH